MTRRVHHRERSGGFTLVELTMSIVVLGIIAVGMLPIMAGSLSSYAAASTAEGASRDAGYAVEQLVRQIRELPAGEEPGEVGLVEVSASRLEATNGLVIERIGTELWLTRPGVDAGLLCEGVEEFTLTAFAPDGRTAPESVSGTHRVRIELSVRGFDLVTDVFVRARMTG